MQLTSTHLDRGLDGLQRVAALHHVALDLPRELDLVRDVEVDGEVKEVAHALVHERVQPLDDDDRGCLDLLGGVQGAVDVVVDGLHHALARLEVAELLVHEVEPLLFSVQRGPARHLAPTRHSDKRKWKRGKQTDHDVRGVHGL